VTKTGHQIQDPVRARVFQTLDDSAPAKNSSCPRVRLEKKKKEGEEKREMVAAREEKGKSMGGENECGGALDSSPETARSSGAKAYMNYEREKDDPIRALGIRRRMKEEKDVLEFNLQKWNRETRRKKTRFDAEGQNFGRTEEKVNERHGGGRNTWHGITPVRKT